jgi:hypothetical protein
MATLKEQLEDWERMQNHPTANGNPYATMCMHCYGRHPPPRDELCPHDPPPRTNQ